MNRIEKQAPVVIIGSGISGLFTALKLSEVGIETILLTKSSLWENNSRYAQGGIAAVLPQNPKDSLELHIEDTLKAGAGLCNPTVVESILSDGYAAIEDLLHFGVPFDQQQDAEKQEQQSELALTLEAGHSVSRIIHAAGDATGLTVETTLIEKVESDPLIEVITYCPVVDFLVKNNQCQGVRAIHLQNQEEYVIQANHTVIATGGLGQLFDHTTNPKTATGDGIALAYQAGALLKDLEFIQFHPTAFYANNQVHFLVSEALRGEGGILRNADGEAFAKHYHPKGELAPRDIVTRGIYSELQKQRETPHVFLDITHLSAEKIEHRFPTILKNCQQFGVDIRQDWIPVAPAAHYIMGGIATTPYGKTSIDNLHVVGEAAHTGLHGGNRLASNSLLECVVLARRVAHEIGKQSQTVSTSRTKDLKRLESLTPLSFQSVDLIQQRAKELHQLLWTQVGIIRENQTLQDALDQIYTLTGEAQSKQWDQLIPEGIEYMNQLLLARLITQKALDRQESRGAHYRSDFPETLVTGYHSNAQIIQSTAQRPENSSEETLAFV